MAWSSGGREGLVERLPEGRAPEPGMGTNPWTLPPGVQPPRGEPCSDGGGGDGRAPGAGEGRDGEVPAGQGALQQPEEGEGEVAWTWPALCGRESGCGRGRAGPGEAWTRLASSKAFLTDLLLLPNQVPAVLLAAHLSLLQEVSLLQTAWL